MKFSILILKARKELGITQEQLARELGVSFTTVNRWEKGKAIPNNLAKKVFFQFCKDHNMKIEEGDLW